MRAADAFFARGSDVGCLLIHGFSANPADLRLLAEELAARGYTVDAPLLPGHGPTLEGNVYATGPEWMRAVAEAHDALRRMCRKVFVIGHSMGGALAIIEAARQPPGGLILVGAATVVGGWQARLLPIVKYVVRWFYPLRWADFNDSLLRERILQRYPGFALDDPQAQKELRRRVRVPTAALDASFAVSRRARGLIGNVVTPTLIVHGRRDQTTHPLYAEETLRKLASKDKQLVWFDASGHQLVAGGEGAAVVERIVAWIAERDGAAER